MGAQGRDGECHGEANAGVGTAGQPDNHVDSVGGPDMTEGGDHRRGRTGLSFGRERFSQRIQRRRASARIDAYQPAQDICPEASAVGRFVAQQRPAHVEHVVGTLADNPGDQLPATPLVEGCERSLDADVKSPHV